MLLGRIGSWKGLGGEQKAAFGGTLRQLRPPVRRDASHVHQPAPASIRHHSDMNTKLPSTLQVVAAHSLMHHDATAWRCRPAPGPHEVVWQNVG